jgi:hypothetical protein
MSLPPSTREANGKKEILVLSLAEPLPVC